MRVALQFGKQLKTLDCWKLGNIREISKLNGETA